MKSCVFGTHAYPSSRRALFMFTPTKSDSRIFVNLRKKGKEKFFLKNSLSSPHFVLSLRLSICFDFNLFIFFSFSLRGTHMSLFFLFSVCFSLEIIYFVPVSISFILIEYSLNICHFSEFFKNPVFKFQSISFA